MRPPYNNFIYIHDVLYPVYLDVPNELRKNKYDICLLDMDMPKMTGFETAETFYRESGLSTPIIIVSGSVDAAMENKLSTIGINHLIAKPAGISQLINTVNAIFSEK